jgi:hypothetical protein
MINLQKAGLVYDLIAKICRQNVPVYDLTAIDIWVGQLLLLQHPSIQPLIDQPRYHSVCDPLAKHFS